MLTVFRLLAKLQRLRGTALDIFGRSEERRTERRLIGEYEALLDEIVSRLTPAHHATAVELAALPQEIRGFGHIKDANLAARQGQGGRPPRPPAHARTRAGARRGGVTAFSG